MFTIILQLVSVLILLGGCTINIYQRPVAAEQPLDKSLLVVPDAPKSATELELLENNRHDDHHATSTQDVLTLSVSGEQGSRVRYMDSIGLQVESRVDAYLNCYYRQASGEIIKVYPNRYNTRYWVYSGQSLSLIDESRFKIIADEASSTEHFMCLASSEDILSQLPGQFRTNVFQTLPVKNFDAMYALYRQASGANLVGHVVSYEIQ